MVTRFEASSLKAYRKQLVSCVALDRGTERELSRRFREGDTRAGEKLIAGCLPFVVSIAFEYRKWGVPLEDLVQQGNVGLLKAANKFEPSRDCRLATYAAYWIRAEIREYVVRAFRVVRLGTTKEERRALRAYRTTGETCPRKLAEASGLSEERVERLLPLIVAREASLDAPSPSGVSMLDRSWGPGPSPEDEVVSRDQHARAKKAVGNALVGLNEREQMIVRERLMSDEPLTLQALGERLGVSKERVRQLEERTRSKLKLELSAFYNEHHAQNEEKPAA